MNKIIKITALLVVATAAGTIQPAMAANDGPWMVRLRGVYIDPENHSDPIGGVGASDRIHVSGKMIPEVDISYFATPHIAVELILTYPQDHNVTLDGNTIGSFRELPPTITAQYHFLPDSWFQPYIGAGINMTRISDDHLAGDTISLDRFSIGYAFQFGTDIRLSPQLYANLDFKKVQMGSDVKSGGQKISSVSVNPWLFGFGIGWRF